MTPRLRGIATVTATALVTCCLLTSGLSKLLSGYDGRYAMSESVYYSIAAAEIAASCAVWTRLRRSVVCVLIVGVVAATLWYWSSKQNRPCGCFGAWPISRRQHLAILSSLGLLLMALFSLQRRPATRSGSYSR